ncbi:hypothetical protein M0802_000128 [Mischocyttarus mexicanus]|nr:hypothetical protein M0802_000128 [Mischocyttarus mexicanus]
MAAVLRVKRRCDEEPSNALIITCKKSKTKEDEGAENASDTEPVSTVVKFAGTIEDQDEDAIKRLVKTVSKSELEKSYKKHLVNIKDMLRTQIANNSIQNRYKIVNRYRSLDTSNTEESGNNMTIIDIEDSVSCSLPIEEDSGKIYNFVYDLYFTEHGMVDLVDNDLHIHGIESKLVHDMDLNDEPEYSSDDSNAESKWNDYPDSDVEENEDDEDDDYNILSTGIQKCNLNDNDSDAERDSDSSIDEFIYSLDQNDVDLFGYKYAKYKALLKNNFPTGYSCQSNAMGFAFEDFDDSISTKTNNSNSSHSSHSSFDDE